MNFKYGIAMTLLLSIPMLAADNLEPPSFSKGFEMLNALGPAQPDRTASWRKSPSRTMHNSNVLRELTGKMQGNTWLLSAPDDDSPMTIHFGSALPQKTELPESPPNGDLEKDVALIIEAISKIERVNNLDDFRRPWSDNGSRTFGPLMLFAAQLHQAGHPKLADQLAWAIFQATPSRDAVIDAVLNSLGDELYNQVSDRFFESHDWESYREELTALVEKLPRGWDAQPAALLVLEAVTHRVNHTTPPKPTLDHGEISPAAHAAITWMAAPPDPDPDAPEIPAEIAAMLNQIPPEYRARFLENQGLSGTGNTLIMPGLWLLDQTDETAPDIGPASELLALGIEAIPVLAALTTDAYPTHFANPGASRSSFSYSRSPAARALETYASMNRPATRGDIAQMLLTPILPDARNELRRADQHAFREIAMEFYRAHKNKDWGELAVIFLNEGNEGQKDEAARLLASSSDPRHHQIFESHILESLPAVGNLKSVITYAHQRKTDAKSFIEKYLPLVREEIGDGSDVENNDNLPWEYRQPGQLNQILRQLESIAEGKSPVDSAREIATGPPEEAETAIQALMQSQSTEPPEKQIEALIVGAHTAEDAQIRFTFLNHIPRVLYSIEHDEENEEEDESPQPFPESQREAWASLLDDNRPINPEWRQHSHFTANTLGEVAAIVVESWLHQDGIYNLYQFTGILKQTLGELCMARAKARLANEPLPTLPSAENVTDERLREIVTTAGSKPASEIIAYLDTLTPDERTAWYMWIQEPEEIPTPESVRDLAFTITEENTELLGSFTPIPGLLNLKPGFTIHEDTIDAYIQDLAKNAKTHSLTTGSIRNTNFPPGLMSWTLRAVVPEKSDDEDELDGFQAMQQNPTNMFRQTAFLYGVDGIPDNAEALINIQLHSQTQRGTFNWWVIDGQPTPFAVNNRRELQDKPETTITETITEARKAVTPLSLTIQVITREDAEKIANH